jgi:hypothetical protein
MESPLGCVVLGCEAEVVEFGQYFRFIIIMGRLATKPDLPQGGPTAENSAGNARAIGEFLNEGRDYR